ncbi:UNVERIFIED_CONTAM: hypothetical protein FKN15_003213 [Acipenser sinensis]
MGTRSNLRSGSRTRNFKGSVSVWLLLWLAVCSPSPASSCPRLCVCYLSPMMVSCQSQNFSAVPAGIPYDSQRVFLQNNRITELRAQSFGFQTQDNLFSDLVNLTHLFFHGNRIRVLSENVFRGLVSLDRLLLHENRVRQVNRKAFMDLGHLTTLFLFNNALTDLPASALSDLSSLQFLRLNGNPWSCSCQARPLWEWFRQVRLIETAV